jgi:cell division protein FtsL
MKKELLKNFLLVFLLGVTVFCVYKYILIQSEKSSLVSALAQAKAESAKLGNEKENTLRQLEIEKESQGKPEKEKLLLKENLLAAKARMQKLFLQVKENQQALADLDSRCTLLKAENQSYQQLSKDYEALKARFSSVAELKKAIKELGKRQPKIDVKVESQAAGKNAGAK